MQQNNMPSAIPCVGPQTQHQKSCEYSSFDQISGLCVLTTWWHDSTAGRWGASEKSYHKVNLIPHWQWRCMESELYSYCLVPWCKTKIGLIIYQMFKSIVSTAFCIALIGSANVLFIETNDISYDHSQKVLTCFWTAVIFGSTVNFRNLSEI